MSFLIDSFKFGRLWTPADMTKFAWYDAADTTTITQSGGLISQWRDKSGNSKHLSQGTGSAQPVYTTGQYATFDGVNDLLVDGNAGPTSAAVTVFGVVQTTTYTSNLDANRAWLCCWDGSTSNPNWWCRAQGDIDNLGFTTVDTSGDFETVDCAATRDVPHIFTGTSQVPNTDKIQTRSDGGTVCYSPNFQAYNLQQGSTPDIIMGRQKTVTGRYHKGRVYEAIIVASRLTEADANFLKMEGYLAHKWNLAGNLPTDHPYKYGPPMV